MTDAALVPPPRTHPHRHFGVLAPKSPLRVALTAVALAATAQPGWVQAKPVITTKGATGWVFGLVYFDLNVSFSSFPMLFWGTHELGLTRHHLVRCGDGVVAQRTSERRLSHWLSPCHVMII